MLARKHTVAGYLVEAKMCALGLRSLELPGMVGHKARQTQKETPTLHDAFTASLVAAWSGVAVVYQTNSCWFVYIVIVEG